MMTWLYQPGTNVDHVGFIHDWFNPEDERPAREQANAGYLQTGGCPWMPFEGHKLRTLENGTYLLQYSGDPLIHEIARTKLRDELIVVFEHAWVAIIQPDGSFEVARCD